MLLEERLHLHLDLECTCWVSLWDNTTEDLCFVSLQKLFFLYFIHFNIIHNSYNHNNNNDDKTKNNKIIYDESLIKIKLYK